MRYRIWVAGLAVYVIAIAGRTSFGVASLDALEHFGINAAQLSLFAVVQLGVYAAAQFPVGIALDKWGSRPILVGGALILAVGQLWLALTSSVTMALAARVLIGMGDATAFAGVLRLIPQWFDPRQVPLYTQLTGICGQFGQIISSLPFAYLLAQAGWTTAFVTLALVGGIGGLLAAGLIKEKPVESRDIVIPMSHAVKHPATWLGFWTHFLLGYPSAVFTLMWGVPMMVANGMEPEAASALLILGVGANIISGPIIARFVAHHPFRRSFLVLVILTTVIVTWAWLIIPYRPIASWQFGVLVIVLAVAGSGSVIGFDYVRSFIPFQRHGTANGIVNQGGFIAAVICCLSIGLVLDSISFTGVYTRHDFRLAMGIQAGVTLLGLIAFIYYRHATTRWYATQGVIIPPIVVVIRRLAADRAFAQQEKRAKKELKARAKKNAKQAAKKRAKKDES